MKFLIHLFVKDKQNIKDKKVRQRYGNVINIAGIFINLLLSVSKIFIGSITQNISITADGINNTSDAASSIIAFIGFHFANLPADEKHPFGHERFEYLSSMFVAAIIMLVGFELAKTSFEKIIHPSSSVFSYLGVIVLLFSIVMKFWMYLYNKQYSKLLHSPVLEANAMDSLSDVWASSAVLIAFVISYLTHYSLDGWMGIVVAIFIMYTGVKIIMESGNDVLGVRPDQQLIQQIEAMIDQHQDVLGIHDLLVHNYGPNQKFASVHVEVDAANDVLESHDMIDNIEREILEKLDIGMVIHMDPIITDDPLINTMRRKITEELALLDPEISMHDFRIVKGKTHSNIIFDIVIPYHVKQSQQQILDKLNEFIKKEDQVYYLVVSFDRPFYEES